MTEAEIVERVKAAIDELSNLGNEEVAGTDAEANLEAIIKSNIGYAQAWVLKNAPENTLTSEVVSSYGGTTGNPPSFTNMLRMSFGYDNMVTVELPDGFLRVLSARLSSWMYSPAPVSEFSETALMQQGRTTKGSPDMPVSVLATENKKSVLKMYTAESKEDTLSVQLVEKPKKSEDGSVTIPAELEKSFIYYIAYLTLLAMRDGSAGAFLEVAVQDMRQGTGQNK